MSSQTDSDKILTNWNLQMLHQSSCNKLHTYVDITTNISLCPKKFSVKSRAYEPLKQQIWQFISYWLNKITKFYFDKRVIYVVNFAKFPI